MVAGYHFGNSDQQHPATRTSVAIGVACASLCNCAPAPGAAWSILKPPGRQRGKSWLRGRHADLCRYFETSGSGGSRRQSERQCRTRPLKTRHSKQPIANAKLLNGDCAPAGVLPWSSKTRGAKYGANPLARDPMSSHRVAAYSRIRVKNMPTSIPHFTLIAMFSVHTLVRYLILRHYGPSCSGSRVNARMLAEGRRASSSARSLRSWIGSAGLAQAPSCC